MRIQAKVGFWLGGFALLILLLWLLADVLLPFAVALAIGYLLDPVADRLERSGFNRLGATLFILILFVLVLVLAAALLMPVLGAQIADFLDALPGIVTRLHDLFVEQGGAFVARFVAPLAERFGIDIGAGAGNLQGSASEIANEAARWLGGALRSVWSGGRALIGLFTLLVITPVVAFYILLDWDTMVRKIDGWIPVAQRDTVRGLAHEIDAALSGFMRGQSLVCLFLAGWYGIGLTLVGLKYGLLIGLSAGVLSFIPYVGSLTCLVLATAVALVQAWPSLGLLGLVLGVIGVGQFLEGNILTPRLVGKSVGLHPVWLMLALLGFGSVFGFAGLVVAVPVSAAVGVLIRFGLRRYLASPLYLDAATR